jgi:hypothetical protein
MHKSLAQCLEESANILEMLHLLQKNNVKVVAYSLDNIYVDSIFTVDGVEIAKQETIKANIDEVKLYLERIA